MKRLLLPLLLLGCSIVGKPDAVRFDFVVLTTDPLTPPDGTMPAPTATLDVGRVVVAAYLDRIEMVSRSGANLITFSDRERWGEVLFSAVPRVLAADLGRRLAGDGIAVTLDTAGADFTLTVTIDRFERSDDGRVELAARWMIEDGTARLNGETHAVETIGAASAGAAASALSRTLGLLSAEIADAVRQVRARHQRGAGAPGSEVPAPQSAR